MGKLDGKIALVTGGARGQGRSHARNLAEEGADIVIADVCGPLPTVPYSLASDSDMAESAALIENLDRRCVAVKGDLGTSEAAQRAVDTAIAEFGRLDVLVVNHGTISGGCPTWDIPEDDWNEQLRINLKGYFLMCKYAIPHMIEQGSGSIIMTSSMAGLKGLGHIAHYTSAKHAVIGLMKALANETAELGIRVNAVCPTAVNSPMLDNQWAFELFGGPGAGREQQLEGTRKLNSMPVALIEVQDVSNMVRFLATDDSRYITGVAMQVDAGQGAKAP